jgi:peroxiredoxin
MGRCKTMCFVGMMLALCWTAISRADDKASADKKTEPVQVGDKAPNFKAETVDGKAITLSNTKGAKVVVICFTCNSCPVARAYEDRFIEFNKQYADKGVKFVAINVNKGESLEDMKRRAEEKGFNYPYAYDESRESATRYGARVTPHLFVIDGDGNVAYIGAFDDNMNAKEVKHHYVTDAVDALLKGEKPQTTETKAFGCGIKI